MFVNYDENGNITEIYACQQYEGQLFFHIPDDGHIYKVDINTLELVINTNAELKRLILSAKKTRDSIIDSVTNSALIDQLQLAAGEITQSIYDARFLAKTTIYTEAKNDFYTTTGLIPPTIQE